MIWKNMMDMQRELDRLFNTDFAPRATYSRGVFPAINIFEKSENELVLKAELPGVKKDEVNIHLENDILSINGEVKKNIDEGMQKHRLERRSGKFNRSFKLPYKVDSEKVGASLNDGILTVLLEKEESAKPKSIQIK